MAGAGGNKGFPDLAGKTSGRQVAGQFQGAQRGQPAGKLQGAQGGQVASRLQGGNGGQVGNNLSPQRNQAIADRQKYCFIAECVLIGSSNYFTAGPKRSASSFHEAMILAFVFRAL